MEPTDVRVEMRSEEATSRLPALVRIYQGEQIIREIVARIDLKKGADGGYYPCVTLATVLPA